MNSSLNLILTRPKTTDSQRDGHIKLDYYTHRNLSCQPILITASYIIVLSIIPPPLDVNYKLPLTTIINAHFI
jgi:hypothetical protein